MKDKWQLVNGNKIAKTTSRKLALHIPYIVSPTWERTRPSVLNLHRQLVQWEIRSQVNNVNVEVI